MSDQWTGPTPVAQQYPKRATDGIGQLVGLVKDQGTRVREVTANLLRSMGVRARPGQMSSLDYDGTDHAHLGTAGWALASDNGGPSYLALNGIDVYADLAAKTAELASQQATLNTTVANLSAAQAQLSDQQTQLSNQLAQINTLISQQVTGDSNTATTSGVSLTGTATAYATASVTVPSGYTRASVIAVTTGIFSASATSAANLWTRIASSDGQTNQVILSNWESAAASHAVSLTGLTAGSTLSASSMAYQGSGSISCVLTTSLSVIYFR